MLSKQQLNLKYLLLIPLIFLFLPAFCIWIMVKPIVVYYISSIVVFLLILLLKPNYFIKKIKLLYKISALRHCLYFAFWAIFSGFILVINGTYSINTYIYYLVSLLIIDWGLTYILPFFIFKENKFDIKFFARLLIIVSFVICIIAILEFLGKFYNIDILKFPSDFLGNQRLLYSDSNTEVILDRVRSVFAEPGWLGGFLFLNMPILYSLILSKYKLFNNVILNKIFKTSLIPLYWITILLAQSAIWLVFNLILTIFYFRKKIYFYIKKYMYLIIFILVFIALIVFALLMFSKSFNLGYYQRIFNVILNIANFESLVAIDQSLGSRLVSYVITIKIGLKNWLLGVGLGNVAYIFPKFYQAANLPFVSELEHNYIISLSSKTMKYNGAIPYQIFAETGIIGVILFYNFVFKNIRLFSKTKCYFSGLELDFANGLGFALLSSVIILFYDITETYYYIWFIFGLANIFILKAYYINKQRKDNLK